MFQVRGLVVEEGGGEVVGGEVVVGWGVGMEEMGGVVVVRRRRHWGGEVRLRMEWWSRRVGLVNILENGRVMVGG